MIRRARRAHPPWRALWKTAVLGGLLILFLFACSPAPQWAAPVVTYTQASRTFHVATLLLQSQGSYANTHPWLLPLLCHSPLLPTGWTLSNPLAPGTLPADPDLGGQAWYTNGKAVGAPIGPDDPAYWCVKLDDRTLENLAGYDLLILDGAGRASFSNADRVRLHTLLEHGATIWVNCASGSAGVPPVSPLTFTDPALVFDNPTAGFTDANGHTLTAADPDSWLLRGQYTLTEQETRALREGSSWEAFISDGVAGFGPSASTASLQEIVRLAPADTPIGHAPAIAAGPSGRGTIVATAGDVAGAIADWWTAQHAAGLVDLNVTPPATVGRTLLSVQSYTACAKLIMNLLGRPAEWPQTGGPASSRAVPQSFVHALTSTWTTPFAAISDPVAYGDYVAVTGNTRGDTAATDLRVYRATTNYLAADGTALDYPYGLQDENNHQVTHDSLGLPANVLRPAVWTAFPNDVGPQTLGTGLVPAQQSPPPFDLCFVQNASHWVGTPVFGRISDSTGGITLTRTVLYALQATDLGNGNWAFRPCCFLLDPYNAATPGVPQVGTDLWASVPANQITFTAAVNGLPRASMTLQRDCLVITTFGKTSATSPWRIYLVDARQGVVRVWMGANNAWGADLRPTRPAELLSADIQYEASDREAGVTDPTVVNQPGYNPDTPTIRHDTLDLLALTGEFFPNRGGPTSSSANGYPAALYLPPTIATATTATLTAVPDDLRLTDATGATYYLGDPTQDPDPTHRAIDRQLRSDEVVVIKAGGNALRVTFRHWDIFFPGRAGAPGLTLPVTLTFTPEIPVNGEILDVLSETHANLTPMMGYPVLLEGDERYPLYDATGAPARLTLHPADGDAFLSPQYRLVSGAAFGYTTDAPLLPVNNTVVLGTESGMLGLPLLTTRTGAATMQPTGGCLQALRLSAPGITDTSVPGATAWESRLDFMASVPGIADTWGDAFAWQFRGDTLGPAWSDWWSGGNPASWQSDFPFPSAVGSGGASPSQTVFAIGRYAHVAKITGAVGNNWQETGLTVSPLDVNSQFEVIIDSAGANGAPDTFIWSADGGATMGGQSVPIGTGGVNTVTANGVTYTLTFAMTTGHSVGDFWFLPEQGRYTLYALDPAPDHSLHQTVEAATVTAVDPTNLTRLRVSLGDAGYALHVGARVLLTIATAGQAPDVWDMGTVTLVRGTIAPDPPGQYWITCTRPRAATLNPTTAQVRVIAATGTPYVSHAQEWNSVTGAEPARSERIGVPVTTVGAGGGPTGTSALQVMSTEGITPGETLILFDGASMLRSHPLTVQSVDSATQLTLTAPLDAAYPAGAAVMTPTVATRLGEGICMSPPTGDAADPGDPGQEVGITLTDLARTSDVDGVLDPTSHTVMPIATPGFLPADWHASAGRIVLPRLQRQGTDPGSATISDYRTDYHTGRIELMPRAAGELADRFVLVHYFTNDFTPTGGGFNAAGKVHHAEIMYVPSPVKWEYAFADVLPDGGPVVVGDTVYVPAFRRSKDARWQPVLYAFNTAQKNSVGVSPSWVMPLVSPVSETAPPPYRGITTPVPQQANGLFVGTGLPVRTDGRTFSAPTAAAMGALPTLQACDVVYRTDEGTWYVYDTTTAHAAWRPQVLNPVADQPTMLALTAGVGDLAYREDLSELFILHPTAANTDVPTDPANWSQVTGNNLTYLADQGLLIADGARLLRVAGDGSLSWVAAGTADYDPAALASGNAAAAAAGTVEQAYSLLTALRRLPDGHLLLCDTGGNRVVETDATGRVLWQYPDSNLTYQDPDLDNATPPNGVRSWVSTVGLASIRVPTPAALRPNGPRDARRYTRDESVPAGNATLKVVWKAAVGDVDLTPYGVTIRWESTLIADAGNNRVLEVERPLVQLQNVDAFNAAQGNAQWAAGFQYRPDVAYSYLVDAPSSAWSPQKYCAQFTEILIGGPVGIWMDNAALTTPLSPTQVLRYSGPDGTLTSTDAITDTTNAAYNDPATGVRTRELLLAVGNVVRDPYSPTGTLRTVRLGAPFAIPLLNNGLVGQTTLSVQSGVAPLAVGTQLMIYNGFTGDEQALGAVTAVGTAANGAIAVTVANPLTVVYPAQTCWVKKAYAALRNYASIVADAVPPAGGGPITLSMDYASEFGAGDQVTLTNQTTNDVCTLTVTAVNDAARTLTVTGTLDQTYPTGSILRVHRSNALAIRAADPTDYSRIRQLDLVTLSIATSPPTLVNHVMVVDATGVREVPCDPAAQTTPVFEFAQTQYIAALDDFAARLNTYWSIINADRGLPETTLTTLAAPAAANATTIIVADASKLWVGQWLTVRDAASGTDNLVCLTAIAGTTLTLESPLNTARAAGSAIIYSDEHRAIAWARDTLFTPAAVLREDPGSGVMPVAPLDQATYQSQVRYLIAQMNDLPSTQPRTFIDDVGVPRVDLFEVRGGNILDDNLDYFVYPDPLSPVYPNLPGGNEPLSQPLAIAKEQ